MITNEQIQELEIKVREQAQKIRDDERQIRTHLQNLQSIKFTARNVEDKPAQYRDGKDPNDESKTIKILIRPATMKQIFDVPAKSQDEPSKDLAEAIREKKFDTVNAFY